MLTIEWEELPTVTLSLQKKGKIKTQRHKITKVEENM
jgi:hypothetical protein